MTRTHLFSVMCVPRNEILVCPCSGVGPFCFQNAALFWWNLHRSGEGDGDTLHAGCPVLVGDKWGKACLSGCENSVSGS